MAIMTYHGSIDYYRDMMQADREQKVVEHFRSSLLPSKDTPCMPAVRRTQTNHLRLVHDADKDAND